MVALSFHKLCVYIVLIVVVISLQGSSFKLHKSSMKYELANNLRKMSRLKVGDYASEITNAVGAEIYGGSKCKLC